MFYFAAIQAESDPARLKEREYTEYWRRSCPRWDCINLLIYNNQWAWIGSTVFPNVLSMFAYSSQTSLLTAELKLILCVSGKPHSLHVPRKDNPITAMNGDPVRFDVEVHDEAGNITANPKQIVRCEVRTLFRPCWTDAGISDLLMRFLFLQQYLI